MMSLAAIELDTCPDVERVEVGAVEHPQPHPYQEEEEVPVVEVPHTVAGEHAVVFPLQDTNPTYW